MDFSDLSEESTSWIVVALQEGVPSPVTVSDNDGPLVPLFMRKQDGERLIEQLEKEKAHNWPLELREVPTLLTKMLLHVGIRGIPVTPNDAFKLWGPIGV